MNKRLFDTKFRRRPVLVFSEPVQPDEKLSTVVGAGALPRSELIKKLWDYIRLHRLQDEQQKMIIHPDENLRAVCDGKEQVSIFELMRLISAHLLPRPV